ncbi:Acetylornithine aminotransferase, partial [hydrothermal vent metagenome]
METNEVIKLAKTYLTPNYSRYPLVIVKGKRSSVWDADGKKYLDFVSGLAVNNLGHCFTAVNKAIAKQMAKLVHTSNLYYTEPQALYAKELVEKLYKGKVFFCNSGSEANEAAIKLARRYSIEKYDKSKTDIIAFDGSFHGRTLGALSVTSDKKFKDGFGPMLSGVKHVPYGDIEAVEKAITKKTCAVIIEPVQGESGVHVPTIAFIKKLAKTCSSNNVLLIFDEAQTGFGRTGKLFALEHSKVKPDIITMAKGVANGFPMGVMFAKEAVAKSFEPGTHASTFGGGPGACAGALVVLREISKQETLDNARNMGRYMLIKLTGMKNAMPAKIKEVRGLGLLVGLELTSPCAGVVDKCMGMGLLINCANENTLRFMPPLTVSKVEV